MDKVDPLTKLNLACEPFSFSGIGSVCSISQDSVLSEAIRVANNPHGIDSSNFKPIVSICPIKKTESVNLALLGEYTARRSIIPKLHYFNTLLQHNNSISSLYLISIPNLSLKSPLYSKPPTQYSLHPIPSFPSTYSYILYFYPPLQV